ncbi:hypothetical protein KFK09_027286 [Dendrobium nobile]|uniref:Secreted protein n=1 Tax=Dendrobium nobile TaxID=94219 RepID=A0A8T3AA27_DENNO|nr:hypothetical protein KFK09_027286 [Dendrobium nobile]
MNPDSRYTRYSFFLALATLVTDVRAVVELTLMDAERVWGSIRCSITLIILLGKCRNSSTQEDEMQEEEDEQ